MARKEHPQSLPGKVVRNTSRAGVGGGAIMIGLALFLLFKGFGPGGTGSSGSGINDESDGSAMITTSPTSTGKEKSLTAPEQVTGGLTEDEKKSLSGDVFSVLIDERRFLIELPAAAGPIYRETPLPRIIELAKQAKGDSNGIKVRILRRETARQSAEFDLIDSLKQAGIAKDATIMPGEFVP